MFYYLNVAPVELVLDLVNLVVLLGVKVFACHLPGWIEVGKEDAQLGTEPAGGVGGVEGVLLGSFVRSAP